MKIEMILSVLSEKFPRELITLSASSTFHVSYEHENIIITTRRRQYSADVNYFLDFLSLVLSSKSFFSKDYQYEFKYVSYLLPIAEFVFQELNEDISKYYIPKKMYSDARKIQQAKLRNYINKSEFLKSSKLNFYSGKKLDSHDNYDMCKPHHEEQNVLVEVHYATNRKSCVGEEIFSGERQDEIKFGIVNVSIPKNAHISGNIERPKSFMKFLLKERKSKHFVIDSGKALTESEFKNSIIEKSEKKSMMIFIHGYNVSFKDAVYKSAQIKYDLTYDSPILLFSWPSKGAIRSYQADKENALYSAKCLASLLDLVQSFGIEEVVVVAHSMGTFCLSEALLRVNESTSFQRLALAAADIEKIAFTTHYAMHINRVFEQTTLYISSTDVALIASDFLNESDRVGDARDNILVVKDMETIDMSNLDKGLFSLRHSYISENNRALDDLYYFLVQGVKASSRRLKLLFNNVSERYWSLHT